MKLKSYCNIIFLLTSFTCQAQFALSPYINGVTSIKDGYLEAGPEVKNGNFVMQLFTRIPLTDKKNNTLQIDRFTSNGRAVVTMQYTIVKASAVGGSISRLTINLQNEYGYAKYKYYLTGDKSKESKENHASQAFELKVIGFKTKGAPGAKQYSPQFRLRYAYEWNAADETAVVSTNPNGITVSTNMVIDKPAMKPTFSPAFSLQYYPGRGDFSYSPAMYYDFRGKAGNDDPFSGIQRARLEAWVFYYPSTAASANLKIGLSPFVSFRTKGTDSFRKVETGAQITVKFATTFLRFF